jgi:hypothetical protein
MTVIVLTAENGKMYWDGSRFVIYNPIHSAATQYQEPTVGDYANALRYISTAGLNGILSIETL